MASDSLSVSPHQSTTAPCPSIMMIWWKYPVEQTRPLPVPADHPAHYRGCNEDEGNKQTWCHQLTDGQGSVRHRRRRRILNGWISWMDDFQFISTCRTVGSWPLLLLIIIFIMWSWPRDAERVKCIQFSGRLIDFRHWRPTSSAAGGSSIK